MGYDEKTNDDDPWMMVLLVNMMLMILLMSEFLHQLIGSCTSLFTRFYTSQVVIAGFLPTAVTIYYQKHPRAICWIKTPSSHVSKKSPTGPTERTPKPEYLLARIATSKTGSVGIRSHSIFDGMFTAVHLIWFPVVAKIFCSIRDHGRIIS